jgi:hypothetical protein
MALQATKGDEDFGCGAGGTGAFACRQAVSQAALVPRQHFEAASSSEFPMALRATKLGD